MNADGTNVHSITSITGTEGYYCLSWSPDGSKIVANKFESSPDAANYLYTLNKDGSNLTQIYYNASEHISSLDWGVIK